MTDSPPGDSCDSEWSADVPEDAIHCLSGLIYCVTSAGDAGDDRPGPEDQVEAHYTARTETGELVESSAVHDGPATMLLAEVSPGLAEAFQLMNIGESLRAWIQTSEQTLIYDLELVSFTRLQLPRTIPTELTSPREPD